MPLGLAPAPDLTVQTMLAAVSTFSACASGSPTTDGMAAVVGGGSEGSAL